MYIGEILANKTGLMQSLYFKGKSIRFYLKKIQGGPCQISPLKETNKGML